MAKEYNDIEGIEAYLDGTLKGEALEQFEAWRKNDPESGRKIAAQRLLRMGMEALAIKEYRKTVQEWQQEALEEEEEDKEEEQQKPSRRLNPWLMYAIAASIVVLLLAYGNWFVNQTYTRSALVEANYELPDLDRFASLKSAAPAAQAQKSFVEICADTALQRALAPDSPDYAWLHYVWGHCYSQQEERTKAVEAFRIAYESSQEEPDINSEAYWDLILALLIDPQSFSEEEVGLLLADPPPSASPGLRKKVEQLSEDLFGFWDAIAKP